MNLLCSQLFLTIRVATGNLGPAVPCTEDAELLQLFLNDRGPEGVATWARDADMKLAVEIICGKSTVKQWV